MVNYEYLKSVYNLARDVQGYVNLPSRIEQMITGRTQARNTQKSLDTQIAYDEYLKAGNKRALDDWYGNVGIKGRTIRYPELSYAGQIYRAGTSIARAGFDYSTADANYYGNLPYRFAGLYGVGGKLSRTL